MGYTGDTEAVLGCTNPLYGEYDPAATTDDGTCETFLWTATSLDVTLPGYVDWEFTDSSTGGAPTEWLWDFGDGATSPEQNPTHRYTESGQYTVTMTASNEWGSSEITQEVEIVIDIPGCMDPAYVEYNSTVTVDDGSCLNPGVPGCMDPAYQEYDPDATTDDGSCLNLTAEEIFGCMDPTYEEYDPEATADDGSCVTFILPGCMDPAYEEYNPDATVHNNIFCRNLIEEDEQDLPGDIPGCTDSDYLEYNPDATADDGSCRNLIQQDIPGCTDSSYLEYNPDATTDDGTCRNLVEDEPVLLPLK